MNKVEKRRFRQQLSIEIFTEPENVNALSVHQSITNKGTGASAGK